MPSVGKDLAAIRQHLGLSVDDIHKTTRIPVDTIRSIDNGSIFESGKEIKTYVRSFVRSYARAMKIDEDSVVKALDQHETGNYNHLLLKSYPELSVEDMPAPAPPPEADVKKAEKKADAEAVSVSDPSDPELSISEESVTEPPNVRSVNWAAMGKRFNPVKKQAPTWLIGTVIILIILIAAIFGISRLDIFSSGDSDTATEQITQESDRQFQNGPGLSLDLTDTPPAETEPAELDEVLFLTVYAAFDKLEPVRVWSDEKPRIDPYWLELGVGFNFEFRDTVRVQGQYGRMLLFLNGHLIENFRELYFNSDEDAVEITRSIFEDDPKWATPVQLEVPGNAAQPDSVVMRPQF